MVAIPEDEVPKFQFQTRADQDATMEDAEVVGEAQAHSQRQLREGMAAPQHILDAAARVGLRGSGYKRDRADEYAEGYDRAAQIDADAKLAHKLQYDDEDWWKSSRQQSTWSGNNRWGRWSRQTEYGGSSSSGYQRDPHPRRDNLEQAQHQAVMAASAA